MAVILVALVLTKSKRKGRDWVFLWYCASIAWWNAFYFLWMISTKLGTARFLVGLLMLGAPVSSVTFFHFASLLANTRKNYKRSLPLAYTVIGFFALVGPTSLIIAGMGPIMVFPFWPKPGPLFPFQGISFTILVLLSFRDLFKAFRSTSGIHREQIRYVLIASLVAFPGGMWSYLLWFGVELKPYGNILIFIQTATIAYAILRYRLIDLNLVARNALVYGLFALIYSGPFLMVVWLTKSLPVASLIVVLAVLWSPLFFTKIRTLLTSAVDAIPIFRERYERFRSMQMFLKRLDGVGTVSDWSERVVELVLGVFGPKFISVLVWDERDRAFLIRSGHGLPEAERAFLSLAETSPLFSHFTRTREFLISEMVNDQFNEEERETAEHDLSFLRSAVSLPIFHEGRLTAIINVGSLPHHGMFNELELAHLGSVAQAAEHSLAVALSGLAKQQTTALWAHDLLKPFTAKGSVEALKSLLGPLDSLPGDGRPVLEMALGDLAFVRENLKNILSPTETTSLKRVLCPLSDVYRRLRRRFQDQVKEKGVSWRVVEPPESLRIFCDAGMIEHRVLGNLVENALRITPAGGAVEVRGEFVGNQFIGSVWDDGPEIGLEDQALIFEFGGQGNKSDRGLAGLGLFIVKSVVEAHGGKVRVESDPVKRTCFYFELPISF
ncbi:MAG: hypothetical protein IPP35_09810 [Elusimicrobia bacterium]|nr:hypothetical protein [Elusimicrobiota bacterium]